MVNDNVQNTGLNMPEYALAVLIYKVLFGGAHPSSYAVAPGAPAMDDFPPYLQQAFRRTFVEGFKDPRQRTTAFEWQELLRRYFAELVECPNDARHAHWKGASTCPYCAAEERGRALANEMRAQMGLPPLPGPKRKGHRAQRAAAKVRGTKNASRGGRGGGASGSRAGGRGGGSSSGQAGGKSGGKGGSSSGQPAGGAAASTGAAGHAHAASFPASNMGTGSVSCPSMQTASGNAGGVAASVTAPKLNIAASGVSGTSSAPAIGGYVPAMKLVGNTATSKYRRARATSLHGRVLTQASRRLRWSAMGRPSSSGRLRHGTVSRKKAPSTSTRSLVICSTRDPTRGRASPVRKKPCERVYLIPNRCP